MGVIYKQTIYIKNESGFVPIGSIKGDNGEDGKSIYQICLDHGYTGTEEDLNLYVSKIPEIYEKLYGKEYHFNDGQPVYIHDDDIFYKGRNITEMFKEYEQRVRSMETKTQWSQLEMVKTFNSNKTIKRVIFTEDAPNPDIETKDVRDTTNSTIPILTWFDDSDSTQYIYTDANIILCPNEVGKIFIFMDNLEYIDFGKKIDSSNVTDMQLLLYDDSSLKQVHNLQRWDTSNVTNMMNAFNNCNSLENLNDQIRYFNTSKVTNMTSMFGLCKFENDELDLSHFDVSNVLYYGGMFNSVILEKLIWHNGKFIQATPFGQASFKACKIFDLTGSTFATQYPGFNGLSNCSIEQLILKNADFSALTSMVHMFASLNTLKYIDLTNVDTSHITNMAYMFDSDSSLTYIDISSFNTESCTLLAYMFSECSSLKNIKYGDKFILTDDMYSACGPETNNPTYFMFYNCTANKPTGGNWDLGTWNADGTFIKSSEIGGGSTEVYLTSGSNINSAINKSVTQFIRSTIAPSSSIATTDISRDTDGSIVTWYDSATTTQYYYTDSDIIYLNEDCNSMFMTCSSLTSLDLSGFDSSNVTNINGMFFECSNLKSVIISGWNTSNITSMRSVFNTCSSLESLDLSNWDTSKVTSVDNMFFGCTKLSSLDISKWNVSSLESTYALFMNCTSLTSLNLSGWNVSKITNFDNMFHQCISLSSLNLSNLDMTSAISIRSMFRMCSSLTSLDLSGWNTSGIHNYDHLFDLCSSLASITYGDKFTNTSIDPEQPMMFYNCPANKPNWTNGTWDDVGSFTLSV